jgi:hypothetical protein
VRADHSQGWKAASLKGCFDETEMVGEGAPSPRSSARGAETTPGRRPGFGAPGCRAARAEPRPNPEPRQGLYHLRPRIELIADDEIGRGLAFAALIRAGGRGMRAGRLVWSGISTLGLGAFAMSRNSLGPLSSLRLPRCRSSSVEDRRVFAWGAPCPFCEGWTHRRPGWPVSGGKGDND